MRHDALLFVLVPLYLIVIAALLIKDAPRPVATEASPPLAKVEKAPIAKDDMPGAVRLQADDSGTPVPASNCEQELRRTASLLRFFANRIQGGEETQSVVADMRQQEKKISAVCD
jgi:hypothetical protein